MVADPTTQPEHCCTDLRDQVEFRCEAHPERAGCPDYLIGYTASFDEYGIWVHTGEAGAAESWLAIRHCPFCGAALPPSRREEFFEWLESRGLELEDAPVEFAAYGWWL